MRHLHFSLLLTEVCHTPTRANNPSNILRERPGSGPGYRRNRSYRKRMHFGTKTRQHRHYRGRISRRGLRHRRCIRPGSQPGDRRIIQRQNLETYSAYFRVQTVTAYSEERGATLKNASTKTNTIFGVTLDGGSSTGMSGKDDKVFDYAKKAQGITATELKQTVVIVISNYVQYAGTTYSYSDGRAIAYIALSSGTSQLTRFGNVVVHEAGGHGFGRLADEYYNSNSGNINNDPDALLEIIEWQDRGYDQNVSLTPLHSKCPWNFIFTLPQYQSDYNTVSTIEGGALFAEEVTPNRSAA